MKIEFSLEDIDSAAQTFLKHFRGYPVFAFSGELGAGKTTFISAICRQLGVSEIVSSPTFSIIQQYDSKDDKTIYHIDLYRIKGEEEALHAGIEDCLYSGGYCFVEWPENALNIFPNNTVFVNLEINENSKRVLSVKSSVGY